MVKFSLLLKKKEPVNISGFIAELLEENEYVILPGVGAFLAEYRPAHFDEGVQKMVPPSRKVSFNPGLKKNDGALAGHLAHSLKITASRATKIVSGFADDVVYRLEHDETVRFEELGKLVPTEGGIEFIPEEKSGELADSFGLQPLTVTTPESSVLTIPASGRTFEKEYKKRKTMAAGIAGFFTLLAALAALYFLFLHKKPSSLVTGPAVAEKTDSVSAAVQHQSADTLDTQSGHAMIIPADSSGVVIPHTESYYTVGGSFKSPENADKFFNLLTAKGYHPVHLGLTGNFYLVAIDSFATEREAVRAANVYNSLNPETEAWVYHRKY
jgi:nucleoid DNA-binding protein